jgi:hypothetical protein
LSGFCRVFLRFVSALDNQQQTGLSPLGLIALQLCSHDQTPSFPKSLRSFARRNHHGWTTAKRCRQPMEQKQPAIPPMAPRLLIMDLPQTASLLLTIEQLQDEVLRGLDDLNGQLERTLRECQARLNVVRPTSDVPA